MDFNTLLIPVRVWLSYIAGSDGKCNYYNGTTWYLVGCVLYIIVLDVLIIIDRMYASIILIIIQGVIITINIGYNGTAPDTVVRTSIIATVYYYIGMHVLVETLASRFSTPYACIIIIS
jgi:hypothetical protein